MKQGFMYSVLLSASLMNFAHAAVPVSDKPAHRHATDDEYYNHGGVQLFNDEPMKDDAQNSCPWAVYLPEDAGDLAGVDYPHKVCHGSNHEGWYTYLIYDVVNGVFITSNTDPLIYDATNETMLLTEANYAGNDDFIVTKMYLIETGLSPDIYIDGGGNAYTDEFGIPLPRWNQLPRYKLTGTPAESDDQNADGFRDTYTFGSPPSEPGHRANEKEHTIALSDLPDRFWMAEFECSQALFTTLCSRITLNQAGGVTELEKNSAHSGGAFVDYIAEYTDVDFSNNRAMNFISWDDINDNTDGFMKMLNDAIAAAAPATTEDFRLPNEVEWEYACRMGKTTAFNTGYSISSAGVWDTSDVIFNLSTFTIEEDETWRANGVIVGADNSIINPSGQTDFGMKVTMELEISGEARIGSQANFDGRYRRWYTPIMTYQYDTTKQAYIQHFTEDLTLDLNEQSTIDPSLGTVALPDPTISIFPVSENQERVFFDLHHFRKSVAGLHMPVDERGRWQTSLIEADATSLPADVDHVSGAETYRTDAGLRPIERFVRLSDSIIPSTDNAANPYLSSSSASPLLKPSDPHLATALIYYKEAEYDKNGIFLNTTGPMTSADKNEFLNTVMDIPLSDDELNLVNFNQISLNELIDLIPVEAHNTLRDQWASTGGWLGSGPAFTNWPAGSLLSEVADAGFRPDNYVYMSGDVHSISYFVSRPGCYTGNWQKDPSPPANAGGDQRGFGWWNSFDFDDAGPLNPGEGFYLRHDYPETGNNVSKNYHDRMALITDNGLTVSVEKAPSLWKLADMHGNLAEFCLPGDYTDPMFRWDGTKTYEDIESDQAANTNDTTSNTVPVRGGNWRSNADGIRSARRDAVRSDQRYSTCGFRFIIPASSQRYASQDVATYTTAAPRPTP